MMTHLFARNLLLEESELKQLFLKELAPVVWTYFLLELWVI